MNEEDSEMNELLEMIAVYRKYTGCYGISKTNMGDKRCTIGRPPMKYIPAGLLLIVVVIALNPIYAPVWFWIAWFGFCGALYWAMK
jgi:hypothetical protein